MQFRSAVGGGAVLCSAVCFAGEVNQIGTYNGWNGLTWHAMAGTNDGTKDAGISKPRLDFVGNTSNAGGYWSTNDQYVFFRMRVAADDIPTTTTYTDTLQVVIDLKGAGTTANVPDYAFAWDTAPGTTVAQHGLEMQTLKSSGSTWGGVTMDDLDRLSAEKGAVDINGDSRSTDGYVRTLSGQVDQNGTSFVDFAVSWSYLKTNVSALSKESFSNWRIAFSSLDNANDHGSLGKTDLSGGASKDTLLSTGWADIGGWTLSLTSAGSPGTPGVIGQTVVGNTTGDVVISLAGLTSASFTTPGIYTWIITNVASWSPASVTYMNSWGASASQFGSSYDDAKDQLTVSFSYSAVPEATTLLLGFAGLTPLLLQRQGGGGRRRAAIA